MARIALCSPIKRTRAHAVTPLHGRRQMQTWGGGVRLPFPHAFTSQKNAPAESYNSTGTFYFSSRHDAMLIALKYQAKFELHSGKDRNDEHQYKRDDCYIGADAGKNCFFNGIGSVFVKLV